MPSHDIVVFQLSTRGDSKCGDLRERRREAGAERRAELNAEYVRAFAGEIRRRYAKAPAGAADRIAAHACQVHSRPIGRTARAKDLDPGAIDLAVRAYIRHRHTSYDELLDSGVERFDARSQVHAAVDRTLAEWRGNA